MIFVALFILMVVSSAFHYVYESIYAPLLKETLRLNLLILRNQLTRLRAGYGERESHSFNAVGDSLKSAVDNLPSFNVISFYNARKALRSDPALQSKVKERDHVIATCSIRELREISDSLDRYLLKAVLINSGGFFFWTWPGFLVWYVVNKVRGLDTSCIRTVIRSLLMIPEGMMLKFTKTI